jgi:hypothetical protein
MPQSDVLILVAQLGISLVGFAGLAGVTAQPRGGTQDPLARYRLRNLIEFALCASFAALIPLALFEAHTPASILWRAACGIYLVVFSTFVLFSARELRRLRRAGELELSRNVAAVAWPTVSGVNVLLLLGALDVLPQFASSFFLNALILNLVLPSVFFLVMVLGAPTGETAVGQSVDVV